MYVYTHYTLHLIYMYKYVVCVVCVSKRHMNNYTHTCAYVYMCVSICVCMYVN